MSWMHSELIVTYSYSIPTVLTIFILNIIVANVRTIWITLYSLILQKRAGLCNDYHKKHLPFPLANDSFYHFCLCDKHFPILYFLCFFLQKDKSSMHTMEVVQMSLEILISSFSRDNSSLPTGGVVLLKKPLFPQLIKISYYRPKTLCTSIWFPWLCGDIRLLLNISLLFLWFPFPIRIPDYCYSGQSRYSENVLEIIYFYY